MRVGVGWVLLGLAGCGSLESSPAPDVHVASGLSDVPAPRARFGEAPSALDDAFRCEEAKADASCFVRIPTGSTWMGAQATDVSMRGFDPHARADEGPVHQVALSAFRIQRNEVSVSQYRLCMEAGWCSEDDVDMVSGLSALSDPQSRGVMNGLSWQGASKLCAWLGGRLPTEAEWERAARDEDLRVFPWGDVPRCGVHKRGGERRASTSMDVPETACENTGPVMPSDLRGRSPAGLLGMAGNVWEWTADWYAEDAYAKRGGVDPQGPSEGTMRVQRGGGWSSTDPWELRSAARGAMAPDAKLPDVGVRCVRAASP